MKTSIAFRLLFSVAACYNLVFAIWLWVSPVSLFGLIASPVPYPSVLNIPLSIGILTFGVLYGFIAWKLEQARFWAGFSLLAKIGPPFFILILVLYAQWPFSLLRMVFFNDLIWWIPFALFLIKTKPKTA